MNNMNESSLKINKCRCKLLKAYDQPFKSKHNKILPIISDTNKQTLAYVKEPLTYYPQGFNRVLFKAIHINENNTKDLTQGSNQVLIKYS